MFSKLKSMLPLSTIVIALCFAVYFGYEQYQDKKKAQSEIARLNDEAKNKLKQSNNNIKLV